MHLLVPIFEESGCSIRLVGWRREVPEFRKISRVAETELLCLAFAGEKFSPDLTLTEVNV